MASEIRVDKINSLSGVGTVTLSPTGVDIAGITTAATLRATTGIVTTFEATTGNITTLRAPTGIVTTLTANTVTSLGAVSGTTGTFSGAISGTTGTFTGDVSIPDTIVHTGDTNTKIRFPDADIISFENGAGGETARFSATNQFSVGTIADITGANVAIGGSVRLVNATGQSATISALPSGTYNTGVSGGSAIVFHRFSDAGGGSDEIAFETHHQGTRHGEAARFNKSGNLAFPSGQGIDFSATGDGSGGSSVSELFSDFETGTFSLGGPVIGGGSFTATVGRYTRIGNVCHIFVQADSFSTSGQNYDLQLSGLPFTSSSSNSSFALVSTNAPSFSYGIKAHIPSSNTIMAIRTQWADDGLKSQAFNGYGIAFNATYIVG